MDSRDVDRSAFSGFSLPIVFLQALQQPFFSLLRAYTFGALLYARNASRVSGIAQAMTPGVVLLALHEEANAELRVSWNQRS